jgi:hypothetical protein
MILKDDHWEELYMFAKDLADHKNSFEEIEKQLSKKTDDPLLIAEIIKHIKKVQYAVHRKNGLTKIGFGAIFLVKIKSTPKIKITPQLFTKNRIKFFKICKPFKKELPNFSVNEI